MATLNVPSTYPTIPAALAVAVPTDMIVVAAGYPGNQIVNVGVDNVGFDVPASVTGIELRLAAGVVTVNLLGDSPIRVLGNSLANTIDGNAGDNYIDGSSGNDTMAGGAGDDTYVVQNAGDVVIEDVDAGIDTVRSARTFTLSANVENLVLTGTVSTDGYGNELDNVLTGNAGANKLGGAAGTDTLIGDAGDDILDGGTGADTMSGGSGDDTFFVDNVLDVVLENEAAGTDLVQSSVSYVLAANVETLVLVGTDNIDGTGNDLDNSLTGNDGSNTLDGGAGADYMNGGKGDDTYIVDNILDTATDYSSSKGPGGGLDTVRSSVTFTIANTIENLVLTGTGNIDGTGNNSDNVITGNVGNNLMDGGVGADTMLGGAGDDTYLVNQADDVVIENLNEGIDTVRTSLSYTLPDNVENLVLTGLHGNQGYGNDLVNFLVGNDHGNLLDGGAGADTMAGGLGSDVYVVDDVGDTIIEATSGDEGDNIVYSSVSYTLPENVAKITLTGAAAINATGNGLANDMLGNGGNNILDGAGGADLIFGRDGDDLLIVRDVAFAKADGGIGTDTLALGGADLTLDLTIPAQAAKIIDVERIDLTGAGDNTLKINEAAVMGGVGTVVGGMHVLVVERDSGDTVVFGDSGWTNVGSFTDASGTFDRWVLNSAEVDIQRDADGIVIHGTAGNDTISATLTAPGQPFSSDEANTIYGMGGDDRLEGLGGDDVLDGGAGVDLMYGGVGNDTYFIENSSDRAYEVAGAGVDLVYASVTHLLRANVENLVLTGSANLNGVGNELDNVLTGNVAANVLDGGAGADTMAGGRGNDTYVVENAGDLVIEQAGEGTDAVRAWIDYTLTANVEKLTLQGTANLNGTGNDLANTLVGNAGNNILDGGLGGDTMTGGTGDDTYVIDNAADRASEDAGGGFDTLLSSITYMLRANAEKLVLTGTDNINAVGNTQGNILTGTAGNNILDGGAGADEMTGGAGNDTYVVENAGDVVIELANEGTDAVRSWIDYTLGANVEKMTLQGAADLDGTGNDLVNTLIGNTGDNVLDGGLGADVLQGGAGDDTYVFSTALGGGNVDKVIGFVVGEDAIHLDHDIFTTLLPGSLTAAAFAIGTVATEADDRILFDTGTGGLYYDIDGVGGVGAVKFATLTSLIGTLEHTDFFVV